MAYDGAQAQASSLTIMRLQTIGSIQRRSCAFPSARWFGRSECGSRRRAAWPARTPSRSRKNEILNSLNKPDDFILAVVEFPDDDAHRTHYVRRPFRRELDFSVTSVNYNFAELLSRARTS